MKGYLTGRYPFYRMRRLRQPEHSGENAVIVVKNQARIYAVNSWNAGRTACVFYCAGCSGGGAGCSGFACCAAAAAAAAACSFLILISFCCAAMTCS